MEDRFLPIREFQMRPNAIRVTDLAYIQGVSINFNQHFPSSKKLSLHKLSIKQLPIDGSVGYKLRSSTNKCKQSNNIDQHTFLSEWSVVLPLVYLHLFQCSFSFFRVDNKPVNESCCATFLGHLVRSRPRDRIRNSIEIRVAFENRIRNRVASLALEGGGRGSAQSVTSLRGFQDCYVRSIFTYARILLCAVIPAVSLYRIRKLWAEIRRVCGTWQVGGRRRLKGTVINRVMGVCGSAVHHGQSCFRSSFNRDPKTSYLYFLIYYSWIRSWFYIPKFI